MLTTLAVVTETVIGIMVGVEFAVAVFVNPILLRLPAGPSLEARADGARVLGRVMPFWYFGSLILTAVLAGADLGQAGGRRGHRGRRAAGRERGHVDRAARADQQPLRLLDGRRAPRRLA